MAKRIADKELTDRNWDQEEEGEEAGTFSMASEDVMKNRNIKKAKRRNTGAETDSGTAFRGFKGFSLSTSSSIGGTAPPAVVSSSFPSFSSLTNGSSSSFTSFSAPPPTTSSSGMVFNGSSSVDVKPVNGSAPPSTGVGGSSSGGGASCGGSSQYRVQLTALNVCVRDWISKHVTDNPLCDLQPIFRDYEKHLASIERSYAASSSPPASAAPSSSLFSFTHTQDHSSSLRPAGVTFNFGQKVDSSALTSLNSASSTPSFSFSSSTAATTTTSSSFGGVTAPLCFNQPKPVETHPAADENGGEDDEEPPKPDVKEVKEDDAFYSQKCKLFYKKDAEFKEKGVGTLHLKEFKDRKTQMIIRADTNLGNILLNVLLQASVPCSRVGKNNVMVVCVPNPPVDDAQPSSPVPLLIRVKTAEDADKLLKTLKDRTT